MRGLRSVVGLVLLLGATAPLAEAQGSCDTFGVNPDHLDAGPDAGEASVVIGGYDGCTYDVHVSAYDGASGGSWLYADSDATVSNGQAVLGLWWDANGGAQARTGTVTIRSASQSATVQVTQQGLQAPEPCGDASVNPSDLFFDEYGGSRGFSLFAGPDCAWQAGFDRWIGVSPASGKGSTTLIVTVVGNTEREVRVGHVTLAGVSVLVSQGAETGVRNTSGETPTLGSSTGHPTNGGMEAPGPEGLLALAPFGIAALLLARRRT